MAAATAHQQPRTLWQLVRLLLYRLVRGFPWRIAIALVIAVLIWVVHTYLLVFVNEGFAPGSGFLLNRILALRGTLIAGTLFWTLLMMVVTGLGGRLLRGPGRLLREVAATPAWVRDGLQRAGTVTLPGTAAGMFLAVLACLLIDNVLTSLLLSVILLASLTARSASVLLLVFRLAWSDAHRLLRRPQSGSPDLTGLWIALTCGGVLGFGIGASVDLLPLILNCFFLCCLLVLVVVTVVLAMRKRAGVVLSLLLLLGILLLGMLAPVSWADDGGWREAGGTWENWLRSQGALLAALLGLGPAFGGLLGSLIGLLLSGELGLEGFSQIIAGLIGGGPLDNPGTVFNGGGFGCGGLPSYWVNTATLGLVVQDTLFTSQGRGPAVALTLSHASGAGSGADTGSDTEGYRMFGCGWCFSYDSDIVVNRQEIMVRRGSGQRLRFAAGQQQEAVAVDGNPHRLIDEGETWLLLEHQTRLCYRYRKVTGASVARLSCVADYCGNQVAVLYSQDGTITALCDAGGRSTTFAYDDRRRCTAITVADGRSAALSYDRAGNLARVVDLAGVQTDYEYDSQYDLTRITVGQKRRTVTISYQESAAGRQVGAVTDAEGNMTRYRMARTVPALVQVISPEWDVTSYLSIRGRTVAVVDPLGGVVRSEQSQGNTVALTDACGQATHTELDEQDRVKRVIFATGAAVTYQYDSMGNLVAVTDPRGGTTTYAYNRQCLLTEMRTPLGAVLRLTYDRYGQLVAATDPRGHETRYEYDQYGNLTAVTTAAGCTTRHTYDPSGLTRTATTDGRGNTTRFEYDGNSRLTEVIHADGSSRRHLYDCCTGVATIDENGNDVVFTRDAQQRVTELTDGRGRVTSYRYDRAGRPQGMVDRLGRQVRLNCDPLGRLVAITDAAGQQIALQYDAMGRMTGVGDEQGRQTRVGYDACGNPISLTDPSGRSLQLERDGLGQLSGATTARGHRITYHRDGDGRVTAKHWDGAEVAGCEYDLVGNLVRLRDHSGQTSFRYDRDDRLARIRYPDGLKVRFSYDQAGNLQTTQYPGGLQVRAKRDNRNRITTLAWDGGSISFVYDAVGNVTGEERGNGTTSSYRYDSNNHLVSLEHLAGGRSFARLELTLNDAGKIVAADRQLPLPDGFLQRSDGSLALTYNQLNQISTCDGEPYTYDEDGNLTAAGSAWQVTYDAENRLTSLSRNGATTRYTYNGLGQRVSVSSGEKSSTFHSDLFGRMLFTTNDEGKVTAFYIWAGGLLVARVLASGKTEYYHHDNLGSTIALTGGDGSLVAAYSYDPFGAVVGRSGRDDNPFTSVGRHGVIDDRHGLYFMRYRHYDATSGRFLQRDPIGFRGGLNLYAYCLNNPVTGIDPEGTQGGPGEVIFGLTCLGLAVYAAWASCGAQSANQGGPYKTIDSSVNEVINNPNNPDIGENPGGRAVNDLLNTGKIVRDSALDNNPITAPGKKAYDGVNALRKGDLITVGEKVLGIIPHPRAEGASTLIDVVKAGRDINSLGGCSAPGSTVGETTPQQPESPTSQPWRDLTPEEVAQARQAIIESKRNANQEAIKFLQGELPGADPATRAILLRKIRSLQQGGDGVLPPDGGFSVSDF